VTQLRHRTAAVLALAALPVVAAVGNVAAANPRLVPDDLEFLNSPTIDEIVANAENGSADCAAMEMVVGIGFIAAFAAADFDFDMGLGTDTEVPATTEPEVTADAFWAISAPVLVPLLDRADTSDPTAQAFVDVVGPQLVGSIYELRDLGFTDDDLLLVQQSWAEESLTGGDMLGDDSAAASDVPGTEDPALADLAERAEDVLSHDFESITFMDEGAEIPGEATDALPWEASCPETAAEFDFDIDVSATFEFEFDATITIPVDTSA
jgi:hypothetical protein